MKNKYVIVCLLFAVVASGSIYDRIRNYHEIKRLKEEIAEYKQNTEEIEQSIEELRSNSKMMEKLAREKYGMKQDNEDVFVDDDATR